MPSPRCSPRPHLHGRAAPLQRASPFPQRCAAPPRWNAAIPVAPTPPLASSLPALRACHVLGKLSKWGVVQWAAHRDAAVCSLFLRSPKHRRRSPRWDRDAPCSIPHRRYFHMINCVCVLFCFCLWRRGTPCFARRRQAAQRSSMCGAMHKSESPSFLQTLIGFVYGEPMHVALNRLD
jgi:hypothetical protein